MYLIILNRMIFLTTNKFNQKTADMDYFDIYYIKFYRSIFTCSHASLSRFEKVTLHILDYRFRLFVRNCFCQDSFVLGLVSILQ